MHAHQITFDIYKVDDKATRTVVEKYLMQTREFKVTEYIPLEPAITASYCDTPRSVTGITSDSTGRIASINVDEPERRRRQVERVEKAVSRLGGRQQRLIQLRYLEDDDIMDYHAAAELGLSDRHYRRIKSIAIYRLAASLGLLVLQE